MRWLAGFLIILCLQVEAQDFVAGNGRRKPMVVAAGGSGGGPFTIRQAKGARLDASGATLPLILTNVLAGSVIAVLFKHEGASATVTCTNQLGTNYTATTKFNHSNNDLWFVGFYRTNVAAGTTTNTVRCSANRVIKRGVAIELVPTSTNNAAFDTAAGASGTGTAIASGNITTAVADSVVLAWYADYSADTISATQINGVDETFFIDTDDVQGGPTATLSTLWARIPTATFTGQATSTLSVSDVWGCMLMAFK